MTTSDFEKDDEEVKSKKSEITLMFTDHDKCLSIIRPKFLAESDHGIIVSFSFMQGNVFKSSLARNCLVILCIIHIYVAKIRIAFLLILNIQ